MPPTSGQTDLRRIAAGFSGRVQGVGFRATVRELAERVPVTGWVRNEPDGRVKLEAQGPAAALDTLIERIRDARSAHITSVDISHLPPTKGESGFQILQ